MRIRRLWGLFAGGLMLLLAAAPAALAGTDPDSAVYQGVAGNVQGNIAGAQQSGGTLPFTGLNLALIVIGGLLLVAMGVTLRRWSRASR